MFSKWWQIVTLLLAVSLAEVGVEPSVLMATAMARLKIVCWYPVTLFKAFPC